MWPCGYYVGSCYSVSLLFWYTWGYLSHVIKIYAFFGNNAADQSPNLAPVNWHICKFVCSFHPKQQGAGRRTRCLCMSIIKGCCLFSPLLSPCGSASSLSVRIPQQQLLPVFFLFTSLFGFLPVVVLPPPELTSLLPLLLLPLSSLPPSLVLSYLYSYHLPVLFLTFSPPVTYTSANFCPLACFLSFFFLFGFLLFIILFRILPLHLTFPQQQQMSGPCFSEPHFPVFLHLFLPPSHCSCLTLCIPLVPRGFVLL